MCQDIAGHHKTNQSQIKTDFLVEHRYRHIESMNESNESDESSESTTSTESTVSSLSPEQPQMSDKEKYKLRSNRRIYSLYLIVAVIVGVIIYLLVRSKTHKNNRLYRSQNVAIIVVVSLLVILVAILVTIIEAFKDKIRELDRDR